jgi:hypothetical protein
MSVEMRLAMPSAWPRAVAFRARRDRLLRWFATGVTVLAASIGILLVAMAAVVLGMT